MNFQVGRNQAVMVHAGDSADWVAQIAPDDACVVFRQESCYQGVFLCANDGAQWFVQARHAWRLAGSFAVAGLDQRWHDKGVVPATRVYCAKWFMDSIFPSATA